VVPHAPTSPSPQDLLSSLTRLEPRNARLLFDNAHAFARLAGRSRALLSITLGMMEAATALDPESAVFAVETGQQRMQVGGEVACAF
jgi:hypothetical protein